MRLSCFPTLAAIALVAMSTPWCYADEEFSLVIDPFTGEASLRNDSAESVELDSYLLTSGGSPVLDSSTWTSLEDGALSGWTEIGAQADRIGELNLLDSLSIAGGASVGIGSPYTPFSPTAIGELEPGIQALDFSYTLANETSARQGDVEFSARNTVVLEVNPTTGEAALVNQSSFDIELDSYLVRSVSSVFDPVAWSPIAAADSAWVASSGRANRLFEGNLTSSTFLGANGGSLSLGAPIDPTLLSDETDVELEFSFLGSQSVDGGVLFVLDSVTPGDLNGDGNINFGDLQGFVTALTDPDGYAAAFPDGDITACDANDDGNCNFGDLGGFVALLTGGGTAAASASVPEPSSILLVLVGLLPLALRRQQKGC